jgi:uncharacterized protein (DUF58 family)
VSTDFVAVLARILTRHGNRVGAICYGAGVDTVIPPRSGRKQVLHIMHSMASRPELAKAPPTDLSTCCAARITSRHARSLMFIVSDFISTPGWGKPLAHLAARHDVVAVRLYDPVEMSLPDLGFLTIQDAETGEQLFVDTGNRGFRRVSKQAAKKA